MERIFGMDIWRGALLCMGVFIHVAQLIDMAAFRMLAEASHVFRMEAFFAVSGFFAALTVGKSSSTAWLRRRAVMLGVPLTVGLTLIVPGTKLIQAALETHEQLCSHYACPHPEGDPFLHVWFLIALLLYTPMAVVLNGAPKLVDWFASHATKHPGMFILLFWLVEAVGSTGLGWIGAPYAGDYTSLLRKIAYYLPFYLLGFCVLRSADFRSLFLKLPIWLYVVGAALFVLDLAVVGITGEGRASFWTHVATRPFIGLAATSMIFRSALALKACKPWQAALSNASYTIYLLHIPLLQALLWFMAPVNPSPYLAFPVISFTTIVLLFYFHRYVVEKVGLVSFLLNGKQPRPRTMNLQRSRGGTI